MTQAHNQFHVTNLEKAEVMKREMMKGKADNALIYSSP